MNKLIILSAFTTFFSFGLNEKKEEHDVIKDKVEEHTKVFTKTKKELDTFLITKTTVEKSVDEKTKELEQKELAIKELAELIEKEEARIKEEERLKEEARKAEEAKKAEEARKAEEAKKAEATKPATASVTPTTTTNTNYSGAVLTRSAGRIQGVSGEETYYNLPMDGVISIARSLGIQGEYWVRADGVKMYGDYIMVAAHLGLRPRGSLVETSLGTGIVLDTGGFASSNATQIDIATTW